VKTETVVRNLNFDPDRPTRYLHNIGLNRITISQQSSYVLKYNETVDDYFTVEPASSELLRNSAGKVFELAFQVSNDLLDHHIQKTPGFDYSMLVADFGGIAAVLYVLFSFLQSRASSEKV